MAKRQHNRPWKAQVREQRRIFADAVKNGGVTRQQRERLFALAGNSQRARHRIEEHIARLGW